MSRLVCADADAVAGGVAFGFQRELDCDGVGAGAEEVVADGVASAVAPGPGDVDLVDVGLAGAPYVGGELLEVGFPVFEVLADAGDQGLVGRGRLLGFPVADDDGRRCLQRPGSARFPPRSARRAGSRGRAARLRRAR